MHTPTGLLLVGEGTLARSCCHPSAQAAISTQGLDSCISCHGKTKRDAGQLTPVRAKRAPEGLQKSPESVVGNRWPGTAEQLGSELKCDLTIANRPHLKDLPTNVGHGYRRAHEASDKTYSTSLFTVLLACREPI